MPQTSYSVFPSQAYQGQPGDGYLGTYIVSEIAAADFAPGLGLEYDTAGLVRPAQSTGTDIARKAGVSVLKTSKSSTAPLSTNVTFKSGDVVPCLRRGKIWAKFDGGSPIKGDSLNLKHSSTTAANQGVFTASATSGTAGSEIGTAGVTLDKLNTAGDLALIDVNYPSVTGATGATGPTGPTGP
jgi:hypothetical protein